MRKACLNMIIKNEAQNLERLFDSIHSLIDYYVISDTGSTDDSIELVQKLGEKYKIKGEIYSDTWVDFAFNRNIALDRARESYKNQTFTSSWLLFIDADEYVHISDMFSFKNLNPNISYSIYRSTGSLNVSNIHLLSLKQQGWIWEGEIHNYIVNTNDEKVAICNGLKIIYTIFQGAKSHSFQNIEEKSREDAKLLFSEISNKEISEKNVHRFFILADAYQVDNNLLEANSFYTRILEFGKTEYAYLAGIRLGCLLMDQKMQVSEIEFILLKTKKLSPNRKEAYYYLGKFYFQNKLYDLAEEQLLFGIALEEEISYLIYENEIYEWKLYVELFNLYFITKQNSEALKIFESKISDNKFIPKMYFQFVSALYKQIKKST